MKERSLEELLTIRDNLIDAKENLETNPIILKYKEVTSKLSKLDDMITKKRNEELLILQKTCPHDAWFILSKDQDYHSLNTDYDCICLNCNLRRTDRYKRFSFIVESPEVGYFTVKKAYDNYRSETESFDKDEFAKRLKMVK